jgi:hypothetical protein
MNKITTPVSAALPRLPANFFRVLPGAQNQSVALATGPAQRGYSVA